MFWPPFQRDAAGKGSTMVSARGSLTVGMPVRFRPLPPACDAQIKGGGPPDCRPTVLIKIATFELSGDAMWTTCGRWLLGLTFLATFASVGAVPGSEAASKAQIDASVEATLKDFFSRVRGSRELIDRSAAVLVFSSVIRAGIGIGGEY